MKLSNLVQWFHTRFLRRETIRQAGMLFSAQSASMFAGFFAAVIQARWMEPAEMSRFSLCLSIIVVTSLFFEFGISSAGARVLALAPDEESERKALGALVLMTIVIGAAFSLFIALTAAPIDFIFGKNDGQPRADIRWLLIATA